MRFVTVCISFLLFLGLWEVVAVIEAISPIVFATPLETCIALKRLYVEGLLIDDLITTVWRVGASLLLSTLISIPVGIILVLSSRLSRVITPGIDFLRNIPPIVIFPILLVVFGPTDAARIITATVGAVLVMIVIICNGFSGVGSYRYSYFQCLNVRTSCLVRKVLLFEAIPAIVSAIKTGASLTFVFVIVTELFLGSEYGVGSRIQSAQIMSDMPTVYAGIVVLGGCGMMVNWGLERILKPYSSDSTVR